MKINVLKKALPVLAVGTILIYGASKVGKIKDYTNDSVENIKETDTIENIVENDTAQNEDFKSNETTIEVSAPIENVTMTDNTINQEQKKTEEPITEQIAGLDVITKKVVTPTTTLNVREEASTDSKILGTITNTSLDLIYQENDNWYKVKYHDQDAYVSSKYSKVINKKEIQNEMQKIICFLKDSNLYKSEECTESIADIPQLEAAKVYKELDNYYVISLNDNIGYVKKEGTEVLDDTFVIVDISDQTAHLYEGNELIVSTNVVTGKPSSPTTKGLHEVWDIETNRYLKGTGYNVYVDYVMFFHNGEGLHDSEYHNHYNSNGKVAFSHGWRSSSAYGRDIYKTNGSHGCVNMPYEPTKTMYEHLKLGDKVLVKE